MPSGATSPTRWNHRIRAIEHALGTDLVPDAATQLGTYARVIRIETSTSSHGTLVGMATVSWWAVRHGGDAERPAPHLDGDSDIDPTTDANDLVVEGGDSVVDGDATVSGDTTVGGAATVSGAVVIGAPISPSRPLMNQVTAKAGRISRTPATVRFGHSSTRIAATGYARPSARPMGRRRR